MDNELNYFIFIILVVFSEQFITWRDDILDLTHNPTLHSNKKLFIKCVTLTVITWLKSQKVKSKKFIKARSKITRHSFN